MKKLWSRKLWMALAGAAGVLLAEYAATGTLTEKGIAGASAIVVAYLASQGYVDAQKKTEPEDNSNDFHGASSVDPIKEDVEDSLKFKPKKES